MKPIPTFLRKSLVSPLINLLQDSRSIGIILLLCTAISLTLTNTALANKYLEIINIEFHGITSISWLHLPHSLLHIINDGLMTLFFFLVGMEIKREITTGELSSFSKSMLPIVAALGGMLVPAFIFSIINTNTIYTQGWGIPMATDIAFSLGIAALLGKRVPLGLKIFLTALAIIDDLGAILAIAIFYSSTIQWVFLLFAAIIIVALYTLMHFKRFGFWNFILGILLWYCFFNSGIHATIAGVIFAFFVPVNKLAKIEHSIHNPVNFIIIPLFALANTAILLPNNMGEAINTSLSWGIILGLILGKPIGIVTAAFIGVKLKWGCLPSHTNWKHIMGAGLLAGIGFTMSIFIAMLAFKDAASQDISKIAVLAGSLLSIILGIGWFTFFCKPIDTKS